MNNEKSGKHLDSLIRLMETLRGPDGCPWDKEQTRESLKPFLIEELHELIDAIDEDRPDKIREELGDVLFQIVFLCQLSKELGQFEINDVIKRIHKKMINRHPHVFAKRSLKTSENLSSPASGFRRKAAGGKDLLNQWEEHKKKEGKNRDSALDGVPGSFPALLRAQKLQEKASKVGFDWEKIEDVFKKLDEELGELRGALEKKDHRAIEDELGDIFFVLVRVSSFLNINAEDALRNTIDKFIYRFSHVEKRAAEKGRKLPDMSLEEMDVLWEESKNS